MHLLSFQRVLRSFAEVFKAPYKSSLGIINTECNVRTVTLNKLLEGLNRFSQTEACLKACQQLFQSDSNPIKICV